MLTQNVFILGIALFIASTVAPSASANLDAAAAAKTPRLFAREKLYHYLFSYEGERKDPRVVRELLEKYRWKKGLKGEEPGLQVRSGPFPRMLLSIFLSDPEMYASLYAAQYNKMTSEPDLEMLYDAFLGLRISGTLPDSIKKEADKLSVGLAKKAQQGKSPTCVLDETTKIFKVSKARLVKLALGMTGRCEARKTIYNLVKKQLVGVQKNLADLRAYREKNQVDPCAAPAAPTAEDFSVGCGVIAEVNKDYGYLFRTGIAATLGEVAEVMPKMYAKKFGGTTHPIWTSVGSIIDPVEDQMIDAQGQTVQLKSFARGLRVDIAAAKVLMNSKLGSDRALAGGLFYAAFNRLIYMLGGSVAKLQADGTFEIVDNAQYSEDASGNRVRVPEPVSLDEKGLLKPVYEDGKLLVTPLKMALEEIGGFGVNQVEGLITMSPWDAVSYDPDAEDPTKRTPFRLIPTRLKLSPRGEPFLLDPVRDLVQSNSDLAEVALSISEFFQETKVMGAFGKFFGPVENLATDLMRMDRLMLAPDLGRMLPVAILGVIAQNAMHPTLGHMKQQPDKIPVLKFQDEANFLNVGTQDISTSAVASILSACHDLRLALKEDKLFEQEMLKPLKAEARVLEGVLQLGVMLFGAGAQDPESGMIADHLYPSQARTYSLDSQIDGVAAYFKAYNQVHESVINRVRLGPALVALGKLVREAGVPNLTNDQLFRLVKIWEMALVYLPNDWKDLPWADLNAVFNEIDREFRQRN